MNPLSNKITHLATGGDPFNNVQGLATSTTGKIQIAATAIFVLVLVVTGLIYSLGGQQTKQKMKGKWLDVAVAIFIVYGATMLVTWAVQFVQNGG